MKNKNNKYILILLILVAVVFLFKYSQLGLIYETKYEFNKTLIFKNISIESYSDYNILPLDNSGYCGGSDNWETSVNTLQVESGEFLTLKNSGTHDVDGCCCTHELVSPKLLSKTNNLRLNTTSLDYLKVYFKIDGSCILEGNNCGGGSNIYLISDSEDINLINVGFNNDIQVHLDSVFIIYKNNFGDYLLNYNNQDTVLNLNKNKEYELAFSNSITPIIRSPGYSSFESNIVIKDIQLYTKNISTSSNLNISNNTINNTNNTPSNTTNTTNTTSSSVSSGGTSGASAGQDNSSSSSPSTNSVSEIEKTNWISDHIGLIILIISVGIGIYLYWRKKKK